VGHEEGGDLTEKVRRHPYSVILFDEIEKAHPDVMHILLQVLEEGILTDSLGRKIDFRNTVIIMTSNLGADKLSKGGALGFGANNSEESNAEMDERLLEVTKKYFKPEFINRVDEVIVFKTLTKESLHKIVSLELDHVKERLSYKGIKLVAGKKVFDFLINKGYKPEYGARALRRCIERYVEDELAEELLRGHFKGVTSLKIEVDKDKLIFTPSKSKTRKLKA
jgi:ATP-dependent Clp protease ATP-binding subunit ClpC